MSATHYLPCDMCKNHGPVICYAFDAAWRRESNMALFTDAQAATLILKAAIATNQRPRAGDRSKLQRMQQVVHNMLSDRNENEDCVQGMSDGNVCTGCVYHGHVVSVNVEGRGVAPTRGEMMRNCLAGRHEDEHDQENFLMLDLLAVEEMF